MASLTRPLTSALTRPVSLGLPLASTKGVGVPVELHPIAAYGDSLTEGNGASPWMKNYPVAAASFLNVLYAPYSRGAGGQTSTQVAARQGGRQLTVTVSGNQIPASGGIAVPAKNINVLARDGVFTGTIAGSIAGIAGTMSTDSSGNWTFTRAAAGAAAPVPAGTQFIVADAVADKDKTQWIWVGRNNLLDPSTVLSDIAAMVFYLGHGRYRVLSVLPSANDNAAALDAVGELNAALAAAYGPRFVDALAALQAANDGSANDLADIGGRLVPRSLRADSVHLNSAGYEVVGRAVALSYPARDQAITPDLGLASPWGEFDSASGWTVEAGWSFSGGRLFRDTSAASEVIRTVPEIVVGGTYRALLRGYQSLINVRNGGQWLSIPAPSGGAPLFVDFTATDQKFGFQGGAAYELRNVSLIEL